MMEQQLQKAMAAFGLPAGCRVTVALSGGMDSVALLHLLKEWPMRNFELQAAHVNHNLRGEAALQDQQFCFELCNKWQIPLHIFNGDAAAYAKDHGMSIEEGARALRYGFLDPLADGTQNFVATAHHQQDQAETFFINLYRGSGSRGLSGIKPRRGGYLRPMLECPKEQIQAYVQANDLPYVTDQTNADTAYLRNFLRHRVLPLLESREEGRFGQGLAAAMQCLREEDEALNLWAAQTKTDVQSLATLPNAVLKRVLDSLNGAPVDRLHFYEIAALIRKKPYSGQVQLAGDRYFRIEYGTCKFTSFVQEVTVPVQPGIAAYGGECRFMIRLEEINSPFTHFMLDCDRISGDLIFRHKKPGDRFVPVRRGGSSHLLKRLKNDRVPRSRRDTLWVLANSADQVLWVEGYGAAAEFACNADTKRVYLIEIGNNKGDSKNGSTR
jgi:tRNA(Ile)-lysidine synthase